MAFRNDAEHSRIVEKVFKISPTRMLSAALHVGHRYRGGSITPSDATAGGLFEGTTNGHA